MGIVNAVDICKYPQHFNRLLLIAMNKYVLFLILYFHVLAVEKQMNRMPIQ